MIRAAALALIALLAAPAFAQETPAPRTDIAELTKQAMADPAVTSALADKARGTGARLRDEGRHIELILKAANAKPGERALDVGSGGGYLALLFSTIVGKTGHVDIHNTPGWINQFPSMDPDLQKSIVKQPNIGWVTTSWTNLEGAPNSYDLIVMGQVYHDIFLEGESNDLVNEHLFAMLKPGGRVVIEDHDAIETMNLAQQVGLHRISHGDVTGQMLRAGFELREMILIESSYDDRRFNVFRPGVRGRTDRYIATFVKPAK